jgi:gas vesicle protein
MYELQQSGNQMTRKVPPAGSLVLGALVGAGIALLLAPATGKDARRVVGTTAKKFGGNVGTTAKKFGGNAKSVIGKARQTINGLKQDAQASMKRGLNTFEQTRRAGDPSGVPIR